MRAAPPPAFALQERIAQEVLEDPNKAREYIFEDRDAIAAFIVAFIRAEYYAAQHDATGNWGISRVIVDRELMKHYKVVLKAKPLVREPLKSFSSTEVSLASGGIFDDNKAPLEKE